MRSANRRVLMGLIVVTMVCGANAAEAQVARFYRGPGIVLRVPYVGSIRLGGRPMIYGVPARPYLSERRVVGIPPVPPGPLLDRPRYLPGATRVAIDSVPPAAPEYVGRTYPTPEELAALDDGTLLNAVLEAMTDLDDQVGRFNTGATWQRYFRLPDGALPPPAPDGQVVIGFNSLKATLERLNSVAANPEYAMIAGLPSFAAAQAALTEVVARYGPAAGEGGFADSRAAVEELPAPAPALAAPENAADGERSILAR